MEHNHLRLQTGVAVAAREIVSQAAIPAIRAICVSLLCKNSVSAENGQCKRLDDISVDDITGFYCISYLELVLTRK